jgi:hypothetical protein
MVSDSPTLVDPLAEIRALPPAARAVAIDAALAQVEARLYAPEIAACRADPVAMMARTRILSDDPVNPEPIAWQAWPSLLERIRAWDSGGSEVVLKARQLGFSWTVGGYALHRAMYRGWQVAMLSSGQREARQLLAKARYLYDHLPAYLRTGAEWRIDDVKFASGGTMTVYPSTEHAGIGATNQLVIADESAFHPYALANYAAIRPTLSAGGQFIALSTADPGLGPSGFFHDLYWASQRSETPYAAVFVPWDARPGRDAAWHARERSAYAGDPERFDAYYPASDAAAFVGRAGLVFPEFREELHVVQADPKAWADYDYRIASIDPGGTDPTAIVPNGVFKTPIGYSFHQPFEFYRRGGVTTEAIINWLAVLDREAPFDLIWIDIAGGAVLLETLRQYFGDRVYPAIKDREAGIQAYRQCLGERRLTHHASCKETIKEYYGYRIGERRDPHDQTLYVTKTPVDHHADAKDAQRYNILGFNQVLGTSVSSGPWKLAWR